MDATGTTFQSGERLNDQHILRIGFHLGVSPLSLQSVLNTS